MRKLRKLIHAEFYLRANPDVAAARMDPLKHYVKYGAAEGRQPHPLFDPAHYLASCPAARNAGNPLLHFLEQASPWSNPHPLFDCDAYVQANPGTGNPLERYLAETTHEGLEGSQFGQC